MGRAALLCNFFFFLVYNIYNFSNYNSTYGHVGTPHQRILLCSKMLTV